MQTVTVKRCLSNVPNIVLYVKRSGVYQIKINYKDYMNFIYWNCGRKNEKTILAV